MIDTKIIKDRIKHFTAILDKEPTDIDRIERIAFSHVVMELETLLVKGENK